MTQQQSSQSSFRTRDFVAATLLLYLSFVVYWDTDDINAANDTTAAVIHFSFFIPRLIPGTTNNQGTVLLSMLDMDGDDRPEALTIWRNDDDKKSNNKDVTNQQSTWSLQVYDLRSISSTTNGRKENHRQNFLSLSPFQPNVLLNLTEPVIGESVQPYPRNHLTVNTDADAIAFYPLAIGTGHILFNSVSQDNTSAKKDEENNRNQLQQLPVDGVDATMYYYCGKDWHDATTRCHQPCPSSTGCPTGERCFADCTSCVKSHPNTESNSNKSSTTTGSKEYHYTAAGGWPSICTVWSQGQITMHTITAEKSIHNNNADDTTTSKNKKQYQEAAVTKKNAKLQLRHLWNVTLLSSSSSSSSTFHNPNKSVPILELEEVAITFVDPISSEIVIPRKSSTDRYQNTGIVVITGTVTVYPTASDENEGSEYATFIVAYNAYNGQPLWQSSSSYEIERLLFRSNDHSSATSKLEGMDSLSPLLTSKTMAHSAARRRSGIVNRKDNDMDLSYMEAEQFLRQGTTSNVNCLQEYRRSIYTTVGTLPYQYDGSRDHSVKISVTHFDHQGGSLNNPISKQNKHKQGRYKSHTSNKKSSGRRDLTSHHTFKRPTVEYGRPNVVVVHNYRGINVYALRNGQSLCHISLADRTAYDDIDHDGILDSIELISIDEMIDDDEMIEEKKIYDKVSQRLILQNMTDGSMTFNSSYDDNYIGQDNILPSCHKLLVRSGFPSAEVKFSNPLPCHHEEYSKSEIVSAPVLLVDTVDTRARNINHHRNYKDIVVAFNNGVMGRLNGRYGYWIWQKRITGIDAVNSMISTKQYPRWDDNSFVSLQQLYVNNEMNGNNPIVLVGENNIAIVSGSTGRVLASTVFPQPSVIQQPYIIDFNDDGTSDIVIITKDIIWGYTVLIQDTGADFTYRIIFGLLLMGIMLAYVSNRFGPNPGKRSTDL